MPARDGREGRGIERTRPLDGSVATAASDAARRACQLLQESELRTLAPLSSDLSVPHHSGHARDSLPTFRFPIKGSIAHRLRPMRGNGFSRQISNLRPKIFKRSNKFAIYFAPRSTCNTGNMKGRYYQLLWLFATRSTPPSPSAAEALALASVSRQGNMIRTLFPPTTAAAARKAPSFFGPTRIAREPSRHFPTTLFAASDEDANGDEASPAPIDARTELDMADTEAAPPPLPPPFLALGYDLAVFFNVVAGFILIRSGSDGIMKASASVPSLLSPMAAATAGARYQPDLWSTFVAGALGHLILAAGSCRILAGAAKTARLRTSNTCKRLTVGTLWFGLVGLASLPGEAGCLFSTSPSALCGGAVVAAQLAKLVTALASFAGWEHGAGGFGAGPWRRLANALGEAGAGCRRAWRVMPVTQERPATFYRTFFVFAMLGNLAFNVPALAFDLRQGTGLFSLPASLAVSSIARLGLLSALLFALKDAAERKRLDGTTFITLNMMIGLWSFGVGIAKGMADPGPFNIRRAFYRLLFGLPFLNNGILSQLSNMGVIARRDPDDPEADPPLRVVF